MKKTLENFLKALYSGTAVNAMEENTSLNVRARRFRGVTYASSSSLLRRDVAWPTSVDEKPARIPCFWTERRVFSWWWTIIKSSILLYSGFSVEVYRWFENELVVHVSH